MKKGLLSHLIIPEIVRRLGRLYSWLGRGPVRARAPPIPAAGVNCLGGAWVMGDGPVTRHPTPPPGGGGPSLEIKSGSVKCRGSGLNVLKGLEY